MVKLPFYSRLIGFYFEKFLLPLGFVDRSYNANSELKVTFRHYVRFSIGILVSGIAVHVAGFPFYFFFGVDIPLGIHLPLIIGYGFVTFVLGKVGLFKKNTVEVSEIG